MEGESMQASEVVMKRRGCIKSTQGPWTVRRRGRGGAVLTSVRRPSERERNNNKQRERRRRMVASRIYAGLKAHGNYRLPKHADQNDVLKALCEEAGWLVEEDGSIHRKNLAGGPNDIRTSQELMPLYYNNLPQDGQTETRKEMEENELSLDLSLSFKYM